MINFAAATDSCRIALSCSVATFSLTRPERGWAEPHHLNNVLTKPTGHWCGSPGKNNKQHETLLQICDGRYGLDGECRIRCLRRR